MAHALKRILCIDDEEDILEIAKLALETVGGFETHQCPQSKNALRDAETFHPDLILLDYMMPEIDGPSTLKLLRQHHTLSAIPVVFMTAKVQPSEKERFLKLGAVGVVAKPFDPMTLSDEIQTIWDTQHGS